MSPRKKSGENAKNSTAPSSASSSAGKAKGAKRQIQKVNGQSASAGKLKIFWAVVNDSFEPVALFAYADYAKAKKRAAQLSDSLNVPHFVKKIKRFVNE